MLPICFIWVCLGENTPPSLKPESTEYKICNLTTMPQSRPFSVAVRVCTWMQRWPSIILPFRKWPMPFMHKVGHLTPVGLTCACGTFTAIPLLSALLSGAVTPPSDEPGGKTNHTKGLLKVQTEHRLTCSDVSNSTVSLSVLAHSMNSNLSKIVKQGSIF